MHKEYVFPLSTEVRSSNFDDMYNAYNAAQHLAQQATKQSLGATGSAHLVSEITPIGESGCKVVFTSGAEVVVHFTFNKVGSSYRNSFSSLEYVHETMAFSIKQPEVNWGNPSYMLPGGTYSFEVDTVEKLNYALGRLFSLFEIDKNHCHDMK